MQMQFSFLTKLTSPLKVPTLLHINKHNNNNSTLYLQNILQDWKHHANPKRMHFTDLQLQKEKKNYCEAAFSWSNNMFVLNCYVHATTFDLPGHPQKITEQLQRCNLCGSTEVYIPRALDEQALLPITMIPAKIGRHPLFSHLNVVVLLATTTILSYSILPRL